MTTTVKLSANGQMMLPDALCKSKRLKAGTALRVTEAGDSILLTPVYPPTPEELAVVLQAAGESTSAETSKTRKQVEAAIARVRARARKNSRRH